MLSFGYTGALFMLGMRLLPQSDPRHAWALLAELGSASYHVFLLQILYFGFTTRYQLIPLVSDMVIPSFLGWCFYRLDGIVRLAIRQRGVEATRTS